MKKSKQKSRKFKRYIRKQLKKVKEDVVKLPILIKIADTSTHLSAPNPHYGYHGNYPYHAHVHSHSIGGHRHNPHYHGAGIHRHNLHEIPRHNHCHGSDSIKVFDKEDSEVRVEEKI